MKPAAKHTHKKHPRVVKMSLERQSPNDFLKIRHSVTFHLGWATAIACLGTLQFGYHLAELNGTQLILSCNFHGKPGPYESYHDTIWYKYGRKQCIPMNEADTTMATTMFTIGGLIASIIIGSNTFSTTIGRKMNCLLNTGLFMLGSGLMTIANTENILNIGRLLAGLAAGSSVVISPILISELAPCNHRGFLGSFLQLSISMGILSSQVFSIFFANDQQWRFIFLIATVIAIAQFIFLFTIVESPKWLITSKNDTTNATTILSSLRSDQQTVKHEINHWRRLSIGKRSKRYPKLSIGANGGLTEMITELLEDDNYTDNDNESAIFDESSPLIDTDPDSPTVDFHTIEPTASNTRRGSIDPSTISLFEFLTKRKYRKELIALIVIMSGNQLCGMNSITFYGVIFLQNIVPESVNILYLTSALALCNVLSSLGVAPLFDKFGRKPLLLFSAFVMVLSSAVISFGLMYHINYLTAIACFLFIFGFSFGLGPLVYLMVPEFTSHNAISIAQSFGTVLNWISNISVAYFFPMFQDILHGKVFFIFTLINSFYFITIALFVPETKSLNSYEEVWDKRRFRYL